MLMLGAKAFRPLQTASASRFMTTHGPYISKDTIAAKRSAHSGDQAERWSSPAQRHTHRKMQTGSCNQAASGRRAWQHEGSAGGSRVPGPPALPAKMHVAMCTSLSTRCALEGLAPLRALEVIREKRGGHGPNLPAWPMLLT